ncbi:MAG: HAD-IA family hydrolase [Gammaproteobacteria bacterium]|nr:HAD-IA family hydrolase [Gammaproteobacteria bacterium]
MTNALRSGGFAAVLFDLDGTLIDSGPDLAFALATIMREERREPLPYARIRPHVSRGATGLLELGFGTDLPVPRLDELRLRFLEAYAANLCRESRLFPGIAELLDELDWRQLPWGIVTNKHTRYTEPLLDALDLSRRACCVVSGDTTPKAKPDPTPLLHAAAVTGVAPDTCVYVGDDLRDMTAAKAAGMQSIVALYGYLGPDAEPRTWPAEAYLEHPSQLAELLWSHD